MKINQINRIPIQGDTYPVKDQLKILGCKWNFESRCWTAKDEQQAESARKIVQDGIAPGRETSPSGTGTAEGSICNALPPTLALNSAAVASGPGADLPPDGTRRVWSDEQQAIYQWFAWQGQHAGRPNAVVKARAGTGKTTTIEHGIGLCPVQVRRVLYLVFNKKNQIEAREKIRDPRCDSLTHHAFGYRQIQSIWPGSKPDDAVEDDRVRKFTGGDKSLSEVVVQCKKLVGLLKNLTLEPTVDQAAAIAREWDVCCSEVSEAPEAGGWVVERLADVAVKVLAASKVKDKDKRISFNDMVWLPVTMKWVKPEYDLVVCDECQDMNFVQLQLVKMSVKPGGRCCVVGDDRQAIYGFRGADSDGMGRMEHDLSAVVFGLTTTYRCPRLVVEMAAKVVPDYRAAPAAHEGTIETLGTGALLAQVKVGDAVLSRSNAPLMPACLQLLRKGVPARIEGRDVGRQLCSLAKSLKAKSVPDFIGKVNKWGERAKARACAGNAKNAEAKCAAIEDQVLTLVAVAEGATGMPEVELRLDTMFADTKPGARPAVVFSTVHKFKGLEADKVWILKDTFKRRPSMDQDEIQSENNVWYVALTRTKRHLVFIQDSQSAGQLGSKEAN